MRKYLTQDLICTLLILLWTYAAFNKLFIYERFRFQLLGHKLLADYAWTIAWAIPAIELGIAGLLIISKTRALALRASAGLLIVFTVYLVYMFNFYPYTPCSCGGIINKLGWKEHIVFNMLFLMVSVLGMRITTNSIHRPNSASP